MAVLLKLGRKIPYIVFLSCAGISFLVMLAFEKGTYSYNWPIITFAMFGYFCISSSFGILWIYTSELYPTNARYDFKDLDKMKDAFQYLHCYNQIFFQT